MGATVDRKKFLKNLRRSQLLSRAEFHEAVGKLPDTDSARRVARELVTLGYLTKFQAEMVLAGRTSGFVLGQYRVLGLAGRGGMGRVFKAVHKSMNRVVALKVVSSTLVKTDRARQLFEREVRAAARLMHPNIVTAYDANQIGDRHYMVMEFVDGPDLEVLVREQGPLPVDRACDFIRQAASGLQHAFDSGMVHRDIKPANLLVQADGASRCNVKILDFGLARLGLPDAKSIGTDGSIETKQNAVVGTPDYLSPEQAQDLHKADIRSDLYSLGCTFYYLLTGQVPFPGGTTVEKIVHHATEEPAPVERLRPEIPPVVGAILRRMMAKKPEKRFQTPAELAAALAPFSVDGPPLWKIEADQDLSLDEVPESEADSALDGTLPIQAGLTPLSSSLDLPTAGAPRQRPSLLPFLLALAVIGGIVALVYLSQ